MANYLAGITSLASAVSAGLSGRSSSGAISGVFQAVLPGLAGLGPFGTGTKPKALHTEFASGEANWQKPYGSGTDIVFYLRRADSGGSGVASNTGGELSGGVFSLDGSQSILGSEGFTPGLKLNYSDGLEAVGPTFGAAAQTGGGLPSMLQSPVNQVATFASLAGYNFPSTKGLAGPWTGLTQLDSEAPLGTPNQTFAKLASTVSSVANITKSVPSLRSLRLSNSASQQFFQDTLTKGFAPDAAIGNVTRTASDIQSSIKNGSISDLSTMLSMASGGITTAKQLIEGINKGAIGFTTSGSDAESRRLGPEGYSRERLAK